MSLLNDMLRDLSQRRPLVGGAQADDNQLLRSSSIVRKPQQPWLYLILFFIAVFIGVLGINYLIHKRSSVPEVGVAVPHTQLQAVSNPVAVSVSSASESSEAAVIVPDGTAISLEQQHHIDDLLLQAERAIGMDRLTSPVEDNAYGYYQKILSMSPDNDAAKEGLDKIASRYLAKAEEQSRLGNSVQAEALVQRARFISARFVQAHEIALDDMSRSVVDETQLEKIGVVHSETPAGSVSPPTQIIKPFVVTESPAVSVQTNAGWKDEQLVRHAQELMQKGNLAEAQTLLKNFIATEKEPVLSVALLADLYIQQDNTAAAGIILENTHYLPADVKAKLKAQLFSASGDDAEAIKVLEENLAAADNNEAYRSLLAGLYHKTANYPQSIISYQRLLSSFGEKPAYWLGLALAFDGLAQHKSALQAYQRLREFPQLQEQVKKYTDQRIAALSRE